MTIIAYLRVSTRHQADSGLGIEAQQNACEQWAAGKSIEFYVDAGVSGACDPADREGLTDALNALGKGDTLLVAKRDRLSRDKATMGLLEYMVTKKGAELVSAAGEGTDTEDPMTRLIQTTVFDLLAQMERVQASMRTRAALQAKKRRGEYTGGHVPFGKKLAANGVDLVRDTETEDIMREVKALRASGLTMRKIAAELNARGVERPNTSNPWNHGAVSRLLRAA